MPAPTSPNRSAVPRAWRRNIALQLLIPICLLVTVALGALVLVIAWRSVRDAEASAHALAEEAAERYAHEVSTIVESARESARLLAVVSARTQQSVSPMTREDAERHNADDTKATPWQFG